MKDYKRFTVTAALPYANGPVHIGHLAGVYIPADIYVRYKRLKGEDVKFICGSDEHGVPITLKAKKQGVDPQTIVDKYHQLNKESFHELGISFDIYSRTSNKIHHQTAADFFKKLYDKGKFIEKTTEQYYDQEAKQFLADRYIVGTCPHCSHESAYGDQCENCGTSLNPTDLINPQSAISGSKPVLRNTKHWYLPLNEYENFLNDWIIKGHKDDWKPIVYGQVNSWLDKGLQPRAVSRDLSWGVPVPLDNAEGKVLYVWFDAPIGYISATKELTNDWEKYWKSEDSKLVHFIGKDNIVFHAIIFPVMLKAEGNYILPDNVPSNAFLNLEGNKISTSRNWAVWLHEYLKEFKDKQDVLRYVLTANAPENRDNDFTWKDFQRRNNNELVAIYGNFVNRALVLTKKYFGGKIPEPTNLTDADKDVLDEMNQIKIRTEESLERYRFRQAQSEAMNLARLGNRYLAETEPWKVYKQDPERVKSILYVSLQITANLTGLTDPFMPFTAQKLRDYLNLKPLSWEETGKPDILKPGHEIKKPKHLFTKIEDETVEQQVQKLLDAKKKNQAEARKGISPQKENISFEQFQQLDIRTGTVLEAEKIPKTKKLLKLLVDTGLDKRTVVSGIAEHYKPESIIGKKVSILLNLEPRKIRGNQSQGMILMAENNDGKLVFINPDTEIENGSEVR
jgi:methionyl-tRNA synthetase